MNSTSNLTDEQELLATLSKMDMRNICMDTQELSMADIMQKMSQSKDRFKQMKEEAAAKRSPIKTTSHARPKTSDIQPLAASATLDVRPKTTPHPPRKDYSIAQFRPKPPKWETSLHTDYQLEKSLYRVPCFDCTGKNFASLGREEPKGVAKWMPPEVDRNLPPLTAGSCSDTFRHQLVSHIEKVVQVVDDEYIRMPTRTERERNMKARAGADLFNLQQTRDRIRREEAEAAALATLNRSSPISSPQTVGRGRSKSPSKH